MESKKEAQVRETIAHMAGEFLAREAGPQSLITVTRAEITPDLKNATIFLSVFPESAEQAALSFTKRERSNVRLFIQKHSSLNFPPIIDFELDIGEKNRQRIDDLTRPNK